MSLKLQQSHKMTICSIYIEFHYGLGILNLTPTVTDRPHQFSPFQQISVQLTPRQFYTFFTSRQWDELFDAIDSNQTGQISKVELGSFFSAMGVSYTDNQLTNELWRMDENFTETVNRESFIKRMDTIVSMVNQMDRTNPGWERELIKGQ